MTVPARAPETAGLTAPPVIPWWRDPLLQRVTADLRRRYGTDLEGLLLYGSRARGDERPGSDYDLAPVFRGEIHLESVRRHLDDYSKRVFLETCALLSFWPLTLKGLQERTIHLHNLRKDAAPLYASDAIPKRIRARLPLPTEPTGMKMETKKELARSAKTFEAVTRLREKGFLMIAAREAYVAALHAARAAVFEAKNIGPKTHSGVRSQFNDVGRHMRTFSPDISGFLGTGIEIKTEVDYGDRVVADEEAQEAIAAAERFIAMTKRMIAEIEATRGAAPEDGTGGEGTAEP